MAIRRKPVAEQVERIRQLASVGWWAQRIADKLKLDVHSVYAYACVHGLDIPRAPNPLHRERRKLHAEIVKYAREHLDEPRSTMAVRFGVSPPTIASVLRKAGLPTARIYDAQGKVVDKAVTKA